ncbi:hypothetical protein [Leptospira barantonii]|uniref:Uncharacterized protein n=1 Tax=Leptospira barantonii TaxID=2023184 RepID=A0ABX4NFQ0_9LEPT|nr:hypothetical protein [Leptospira barantonii]PJZ55635.1 hypothetical protein CH367_19365 [Leptospira barantonii]
MQVKILAHKEEPLGIVLLRYHPKDFQKIANTLLKFLDQFGAKLYGKFAVLTATKVRIREIHL